VLAWGDIGRKQTRHCCPGPTGGAPAAAIVAAADAKDLSCKRQGRPPRGSRRTGEFGVADERASQLIIGIFLGLSARFGSAEPLSLQSSVPQDSEARRPALTH
jgi:hypothetical protein